MSRLRKRGTVQRRSGRRSVARTWMHCTRVGRTMCMQRPPFRRRSPMGRGPSRL
jgi:hypothetical protein